MSKSKTVLEMTAAGLDAPREKTTPLMHRSCNDGVIQLSPLSSYAVLENRRPKLLEITSRVKSTMNINIAFIALLKVISTLQPTLLYIIL